MAVLSKCVVGSSLVQLALGTEGVEEVTLSKLSDITPAIWAVMEKNGTLTKGSDSKSGDLSEIMEHVNKATKLKDTIQAGVCGKFREFKEHVYTSAETSAGKNKQVYTIDFSTLILEVKDTQNKTLADLWEECMRKFANDQNIATDQEVSMLNEPDRSSIEFIEKISGLKDPATNDFKQLFGTTTAEWVTERQNTLISKCTKEEFVEILESKAGIWNDKLRAEIFKNMDLTKAPTDPPAPDAPTDPAVITIDQKQKEAIAKQVVKEINANTDPFGIDIMKSKGLLALLVSGLFMTACNFAWNFYQWKLKESSDVDNEEDDSTDPESDE